MYKRQLLVIGSMIGSGIFIVSADIARNVGSAGWLVVVWLVSGFITPVSYTHLDVYKRQLVYLLSYTDEPDQERGKLGF